MLAPFVVLFLFLFIVFIIAVTLLNYKYVSKYDDLTKLEEWGHRFNLPRKSIGKLGPHSPSEISLEMHQRSLRSMAELKMTQLEPM
uniref:Uncharacterized protein n=1 Tax=Acrobeloides nanus TaxID=290746 RepID=A0A914DTA5_9BILA